MPRHLLVDDDLSPAELAVVLDDAARRKAGELVDRPLAGRAVALVFDKPSTRTRVSFEVGVVELGGHPVVLDTATTQLGRGEPIEDFARVLDRQVSALVWRTSGQERLEAAASVSAVPVVNALTDSYHPCQALADLQTVREEFGRTQGVVLAYVGDGNNMAHSLLLAGAAAGMTVRVASPEGFAPDDAVVARAREIAAECGGSVETTSDLAAAVDGAHVLYTDVWASMGQEEEAAARRAAFAGWTLDVEHLDAAADEAVVLHCLPAHRGEEVSAALVDGPASRIWSQAENRRHAQKAVLAFLVAASTASGGRA